MHRIECTDVTVVESEISVQLKMNTKFFGKPEAIPEKLSIFSAVYDDTMTFLNYTACFEKAILLHDDVLCPFLLMLKKTFGVILGCINLLFRRQLIWIYLILSR